MTTVTLHLGDCLEYMRTMQDKSVDFCFTDPPYNVKKNYGEYKDDLPESDYLSWIEKIIDEIKRVSVKSCIYVPQKYIRRYWWMLGDDFRQIVLTYSPEGAIRWGFVNQFSSLLTNAYPIGRVKNVWHNCQIPGLGWFFREDNFEHPGYTSEDITTRAINGFTRQGETVFDPFSGTGTTGKICVLSDRNFIGVEQESRWYAIAQRRIRDAQAQPNLFEAQP